MMRYLMLILGVGGIVVANAAPYVESLFIPLLGLSLVLLAGCGVAIWRMRRQL